MLKLDRRTLAQLLQGNQQAIVTFERMINDVGDTLPSTIEEANALAGQALALAQAQGAMLSLMAEVLARLETMPAAPPHVDPDDNAPRAHLGTISTQNHDAVAIAGGTANFDAGTAAAPSLTLGGDASTGLYRGAPDVLDVAIAGAKLIEMATLLVAITGALTVSKQVSINVATGTAPLVVTSTTRVSNLNVDRAATADGLSSPTTYNAAATDLPTVIALANQLRAAAISKGL